MDGIVALAAVAAFGAWSYLCFHYGATSAVTAYQVKLEAADKKVEEIGRKAAADAATALDKQQTKFNEGLEVGKAQAKTVYIKGESYVAANAQALNSHQCDIGADGVSVLNSAITDLRIAAAADVLGIPVPGASAPAAGSTFGIGVVPAVSGKPAAATGVRPKVPKPDSSNSGSGSGVQGRPEKPRPIK